MFQYFETEVNMGEEDLRIMMLELGWRGFARQREYAHILVAVSQKAASRECKTVRDELCVVSKKMRWDWILKASGVWSEGGFPLFLEGEGMGGHVTY